MTNKELIMKVFGDITMRINSQSIDMEKHIKIEKEKILVLLTGSNLEIDRVMDNLKKLGEKGCLLQLCFSKSAEEILDAEKVVSLLRPYEFYLEEDKKDCLSLVKNSDIAIVPVLTQNTLIKTAGGIQDSFISTLLWKLLWFGKKVFINPNSALDKSNMPCKNDRMFNLMNNNIEKLREFGAEIIDNHNYMAYINKDIRQSECQKKTSSKEEMAKLKQVVTEKDILNLEGVSKELVISKDAIITPLAKDTAKDMEIEIIYK